MDPEGGNQPIYSGDGRRAIVGNGEIYNFPALREELSERHTFRTRSDTESALHLYEDLAQGAAERLDGMFAFAIADGEDLYAARDPVGIKPLYLGRRGGGVVFGSELKALVGVADSAEEFPPGSWYHSRVGIRQYRRLPKRSPQERPPADHARRLRDALERAVGKRLMSDVPVGAFLSGGLDSSVICALLRPHVDELHTFSVGLAGSRDLQAARVVARHLDTTHHEYVLDPDEIVARLPEIVWSLESYDQDLVRSAVPCYFTSRLAARHVKVILTGEGADELFAGYTYYRNICDADRLGDELYRSVCSLHNVNLQRVDRLTMAHGLEGRVPFLDEELIALAQTIPHALKLREGADGTRVEKWILRKACEDLLPAEIVWRDKEQFDEGSGAKHVLAAGLAQYVPPEGAAAYAARHRSAHLRSAEECAYHKLLGEAYGHSPLVLDNVARWSDRPAELGLAGEVRIEPFDADA
jgi:asparagine synthase (glutamine-hydrolysing)